MNQDIIKLFDEYTHKPLTRKAFMGRLIKITGSLAAAMTVLPLLEGSYAKAGRVSEDDTGLDISEVSYPGEDTTMKGYLAVPKSKGKKGAVIVIHENRGLTPHIKDVTRRVAKAGFIALGVDALSPFGGTPANEDEGRTLIGKLDKEKNLKNYLKSLDYVRSLKDSTGKTGCVGFCWGGSMANQLAVNDPKLNAAVAYYGGQAAAADVPKIKAALLLHYAALDERINAGIPAYEAALKENKTNYELYIYEGVNHAFNNDSSPARYNEAAAKLAWGRTIGWFEKCLK